jgi:glycosyltransferase involved in cell wall biosynthesis
VGGYYADFAHERPRWEGRFTHIPHLTHHQLASEYQRSTAFVLPSTEEGFARVVTEAMASGLPIVATHESGATTMVTHEQEGLIVPSRDTLSLTQALLRLIHEPDLCRQLGKQAAQKGHQKNSWQDYGDRCLAAVRAKLAARSC